MPQYGRSMAAVWETSHHCLDVQSLWLTAIHSWANEPRCALTVGRTTRSDLQRQHYIINRLRNGLYVRNRLEYTVITGAGLTPVKPVGKLWGRLEVRLSFVLIADGPF